ncbi:MAG: hypothetical protein KF753_06665 [Caldilineaceae bacterium]|nr:hypothetical protein [Caldilineaceae bacterium]
MAVNTTHMQKNLWSDTSTGIGKENERVKTDAHQMETSDVQKEAVVGRILRSVGKGIKTGLLAHGMAMTSGKM